MSTNSEANSSENQQSIPPAVLSFINSTKNQANYYLTRLDKELSKHDCAIEIERRTGLPKSYCVLGIGALYFILIFFNIAAKLFTNLLAFVYPAMQSFQAIESNSKEDDTQWLTYWIVISFAQIVEYFSDALIYWFPFYYLFKTMLILWLLLPQFKGAQFVYSRFVRPCLLNAQSKIEKTN